MGSAVSAMRKPRSVDSVPGHEETEGESEMRRPSTDNGGTAPAAEYHLTNNSNSHRQSNSSRAVNLTVDVDAGNPNASSLVMMTPRRSTNATTARTSIQHRENSLNMFVPFTPAGDAVNIYRYYCPICMAYYQDILKTNCCGNYVCLRCCKDYLLAQGLEAESVCDIVGNSYLQSVSIACPHCTTPGFDPKLVLLQDDVRDYSTKDPQHEQRQQQLQQQQQDNAQSPVKVGDTFEDLKRKMVPFRTSKASSTKKSKRIVVMNNDNSDTGLETAAAALRELNDLPPLRDHHRMQQQQLQQQRPYGIYTGHQESDAGAEASERFADNVTDSIMGWAVGEYLVDLRSHRAVY
jgi:hypothetical protein